MAKILVLVGQTTAGFYFQEIRELSDSHNDEIADQSKTTKWAKDHNHWILQWI